MDTQEPTSQKSSFLNNFVQNYPIFSYTLGTVGLVTLGTKFFQVSKYLVNRSRKPFTYIKNKYGEGGWVVVTGATDGIGKQFAREFARNDYNLVIIGRNPEKLDKVSNELKDLNSKINIKQMVMDYKQVDNVSAYEAYTAEIKTLDVCMLINNAGVSHTNWHDKLTSAQISELVNVNCLSTAMMSNKTIPMLRNRSKRTAIVNISSFTGVHPIPFLAAYSGSKAFIDTFSKSLAIENQDKIDVLSLTPLYVSTKMTRFQKVRYDTVSVEDFVDSSLRQIGRSSHSFGHFKHQLMHLMYAYAPEKILHQYKWKEMKGIVDYLQKMEELRAKRGNRNR